MGSLLWQVRHLGQVEELWWKAQGGKLLEGWRKEEGGRRKSHTGDRNPKLREGELRGEAEIRERTE